jgi:hypothetical protein
VGGTFWMELIKQPYIIDKERIYFLSDELVIFFI